LISSDPQEKNMSQSLVNHDLVPHEYTEIIYEIRPCLDNDGKPVEGLNNAWIWLNNPKQYNSYTTAAVKEVILAMRQASNDRSVVAIVFTAVGEKAFCTGGNTKEYAEYYSGRPLEYKQYMRLFNDMITAILHTDKPVICRVNGMRIAGGQEIGMACDFTVASDLATFGQAGPRHGSAPDGGSTDFLDLYVGIERAMQSGTLCELWSAYESVNIGLITKAMKVLKTSDGSFIRNPMVITDTFVEDGEIVYGKRKEGEAMKQAREVMANATIDFTLLDEEVNRLCTKFMYLFPDCLNKTLNSMRKKKLEHWDRNAQTNRDWLGLNMNTEAKAGFRAFNEGKDGKREIDFIKFRRMIAEGHSFNDELVEAVLPR
jgi:6-oxocyclohex-1-ene-carbonyl-CoA hydrolase